MIYDKKTNKIIEKAVINAVTGDIPDNLNAAINNPATYPCHPSCKELWEDVAEKIEGVDYTLQKVDKDNEQTIIIIAYPIQEESEDELWRECFKIFNDLYPVNAIETLRKSFTIKRKV